MQKWISTYLFVCISFLKKTCVGLQWWPQTLRLTRSLSFVQGSPSVKWRFSWVITRKKNSRVLCHPYPFVFKISRTGIGVLRVEDLSLQIFCSLVFHCSVKISPPYSFRSEGGEAIEDPPLVCRQGWMTVDSRVGLL